MGWQPETQPKGKPPVEKTKGTETMQRLIDANALIEAMTKFSNATGEDMTHGIFYAHIAPTIDAEPVRHGKWTVTPVYIKCSECGESFMLIPQNYCPNCGARMDAE